MNPDISIVIAVFNEAPVLSLLADRLTATLENISLSYEIIYIDDGSTDKSWSMICSQCADPRYRGLRLSRNFGHQLAITAGLDAAVGRAVIIMDADLQDPPEILPLLIKKWQQGYDVVYAVRSRRDSETWWKRYSAAIFYRLLQRITAINIPVDAGDFRLMSRQVVDSVRQFPERTRFLRGMVAWVGFRQTSIAFERPARAGGHTKYPLPKMLRLASDAITAFSTLPLQLATGLGFLISMGCFSYATWASYAVLYHGRVVPGWASLMVAILLVGGVQLVCLGVIGSYIGRILTEVQRRPLYLVGETTREWSSRSPV